MRAFLASRSQSFAATRSGSTYHPAPPSEGDVVEAIPFIAHDEQTKAGDTEAQVHGRRPTQPWARWASSPVWLFTTVALLGMLVLQCAFQITTPSYASGFRTELAELKPAIKFHQTRFSGAIRDRDNGTMYVPSPAVDASGRRFSGPPSEEVDQAWENLIFGRYVSFRDDEVEWMDRDSGVPRLTLTNMSLPSKLAPGYYGGPDMLHSLHCINGIRKHLDADYYAGEKGIPKEYQRMHIYHCIEQLRQAVLCHGDLTPVTLKPVKDQTGEVWALLGETERLHTCRDGVALAEAWRKRGAETGFLASP